MKRVEFAVLTLMSFLTLMAFTVLVSGCTNRKYELSRHGCETSCEPRRYRNMVEKSYWRSMVNHIETYKCFCRSDSGDWLHYKQFKKE